MISIKLFLVFATLFSAFQYEYSVDSSKIISFYAQGSRSHYIAFEGLLKELARRGHEVTSVSYFPQKKPLKNFRDIPLILPQEFADGIKALVDNAGDKMFFLTFMTTFNRFFEVQLQLVFDHPEVQRIAAEESFDLVIFEGMTCDVFMGFGAHFNCPIVALSSLQTIPTLNELVGNSNFVSFIPVPMLEFDEPMNFGQRVVNFVFHVIGLYMNQIFYNMHERFYLEHFPSPRYPTIQEMRKNVSLVMTNYHFSQGNVRPLVPALIEIGGVQVKQYPDPLPENLQKWMDEATHGVVYVSMGSNIKSHNIPIERIEAFTKTFAKLKQRVVWKFENKSIPLYSKNVFISQWLPQDDLLAHPNLKVFITHGGLGSIVESKVRAIPIVGIPIFADQMSNVQVAVREGWGIEILFPELTAEKLVPAVEEVIKNPVYKENVQRLSDLFLDRPMPALETGVFWIEYVLRHRGAKHMQSNSVHLNTFQLYSIDVICFLLVIILSVLFIVFVILRYCFRLVFKKLKKNKIE